MDSHTERPGYGVLGLGVGMAHAEAAFMSENTELIALCDINSARLNEAAEAFPGAKKYTDFDEMLADPALDIISICLPSGMHAEYAEKALKAGKHILLEKPIDISLEAAERVIEAKNSSGRKCGICFQNRNNIDMAPIKEAIDSGRMGRLLFGTFAVKWFRQPEYFTSTPWRGTWSMDGGGSLINQSVHTVDLMQWLMGEVESVTSKMCLYDHNIETEDFTASIVNFRSGATATFLSATCAYPGISTEIGIYGTGGSAEANADRLLTFRMKDSKDPEAEERLMLEKYGRGNSAADYPVGHASMVEDIVDAVRNNRDPQVPPEEAVKSLRIIRAIYDSAKSGKTVAL